MLTSLLVIKNQKGEFRSLIMKTMGLPAYFLFKKKKDLLGNSYRKLDNEFTGFISYYDWDENLLRGERYQLGKKIAGFSPSVKSRGGKTTLDFYCEDVAIDHYQRVCVGSYCDEWTYEYTEWISVCNVVGGGGGVPSGGGGSGSGSVGGGGSGGGSGGSDQVQILLGNIGDPVIQDVQKYLNCFGPNQYVNASNFDFKITVFVQEPAPGTGSSSGGYFDVGHVCIGLQKIDKSNPSQSVNQVIGWYPSTWFVGFGHVPSSFKNNGTSSMDYTVKVTYDVNEGQFSRAIYAIASLHDMTYSLSEYNCTTFVFNVLNFAGGIDIPQNQAQILTQTGYTPGRLGVDLRNRASSDSRISIQSGKVPKSKGECN